MTQAVTRPDEMAFGLDAALAYEMAANDWKAASNRVLELRAEIPALRQEIDDLEAEVLVNGGTEAHPIDGKNDTTRKAQLAVALVHDDRFQEALGNLRDIEADLRSAEADMSDADHRMRGARLRLEWSAAWVQRVAAAEGRRVERE